MARARRQPKQVTRFEYEAADPATPETGHTALLPDDEQVVTVPMDNGWVSALDVSKLDGGETVVVDMDPSIDPVLLWAGKRDRRDVPVLPLQRNEIVSESRINQIVERARRNADNGAHRQTSLSDLEKELRESGKEKRVEFYTYDEGWRNKLICGDSLEVMESLLRYEGLVGAVQMIYIDPPYAVDYNSNFQQRLDTTKNESTDQADDVVAVRAFRDAWLLGVHSYLSHLQERLYLCRELLADSGSVFVQIGEEHVHLVRAVLDEVFGRANYVSEIAFLKTSGKGGGVLDAVYDTLLWYAKDKERLKYKELYRPRPPHTLAEQYTLVELADGQVRRITPEERDGAEPLPKGARRFMPDQLSSQGESAGGSPSFEYEGVAYSVPPNTHWKTSEGGLTRLAEKGRLYPIGKRLRYRRYAEDFPLAPYTNVWGDTIISGFASQKQYAVQTSPKVVERCIAMTTDPGDLVFDPTCGSGTTAYCAEKLGRRWITCDSSRVATNLARRRLVASLFDQYRTQGETPSSGFVYRTVERITLKSLAYDMEPERIELLEQPEIDKSMVRVAGPFEVMSVGRYSLEDWKGYLVGGEGPDAEKLENYVEVICRLYRPHAEVGASGGFVHAIAESGDEKIGISVGPLTGRVTARQILDAASEAKEQNVGELHVLGWAFEANVGEEKAAVERNDDIQVRLIMIRPDALAEGLKITNAEMLFSPLALPEIRIEPAEDGKVTVTLEGVGLFNRKERTTAYHAAGDGYIAAWYLDEDYDGDCLVDCQMFFEFKNPPNLTPAAGIDVDEDEFKLVFTSEPFELGEYRRVAVKVVDVYGNESTIVRDL